MDWTAALFGEPGHLSVLQECARSLLIFVYGLFLVRLAGRRIFGKWGALDIIVSIVVGSNLSRALTGSAPLLGTLAATTLLIALHWVLSHLAARSPAVSHVVEGRAVTLTDANGMKPKVQVRHAVTEADVNEALRQRGMERVEDARLLTLEPSGKITVLKKG